MLAFGYECKLFRDDEMAEVVHAGQTLIPCHGRADLLVDKCVDSVLSLALALLDGVREPLLIVEMLTLRLGVNSDLTVASSWMKRACAGNPPLGMVMSYVRDSIWGTHWTFKALR